MTKRKSTKRALLLSALSLLMCVSMLIGSTFAWFTDSVTSSGNKIQAGNLDLDLYLWTAGGSKEITNESAPIFGAGSIAQDNNAETLWEPGKTQVAYLSIKNNGSLDLKYKVAVDVRDADGEQNLYEVMQYAIINDAKYADVTAWDAANGVGVVPGANATQANDVALKAGEEHFFALSIHMLEEAGNEYMNGQVDFDLKVLATQLASEFDSFDNQYDANAKYPPDKWDGKSSYNWYFSTIEKDPNAKEFTLNTAEDLAGLVDLVDGTAASPLSTNALTSVSFEDKIIKLNTDIDLYVEDANGEPVPFDPIGSYRFDQIFKGTFDGQGHTIYNLNQNTWALDNGYYYKDCGLGLFGAVEDATIKNLTIDGANISGESALCGTVAAVAGGDCTFENITIKNTKVADYQYYAGGIVGWASGTHTYKNINMDASTIIGSQWGDFGNSNGGVVGGMGSSAAITIKDSVVACRIDATNDVVSAYQWYNYRNSGMLVGRVPQTVTNGEVQTVATPNVTCENVTVVYGNWANYTYCEFAGTGYPFVRVQAGVSVDGYSNVRYGHPTDADGKTVVDDNHRHNDGEEHHKLVEFNQLFGGPADHRYCYYGIDTHPGVNVIYNNK